MADAARWRKWKPAGAGLTKPADAAAGGGFVSFVSSERTATDKTLGEPRSSLTGPQVAENENTAQRLEPGRDQPAKGFVSFGGFVSRHPFSDKDAGLRWMSWAEWKAQMLNRLFLEQGVTGRPGRITAATVLHGERKRREQLLK